MYKGVKLLNVDIERVLRVTYSQQRRSTASLLHGALAEGSRIRKPAMVEDVIEVKTFDTYVQTIVRDVAYGLCVDVARQGHAANAIIVARLSIEEVYAYLRTVETEVKLFFLLAGT